MASGELPPGGLAPDWRVARDAALVALEHEKKVTAMIHDLYGLAVRENDYASQMFLQWFVTEQVEEEKNAGDVVETLKMVGDKSEAIFLLDRELGQRRAEEQPSG